MRILFASSDPGSAQQNNSIARYNKSIDKVNFNIKYTKQYEFGTNINNSDYLEIIL